MHITHSTCTLVVLFLLFNLSVFIYFGKVIFNNKVLYN